MYRKYVFLSQKSYFPIGLSEYEESSSNFTIQYFHITWLKSNGKMNSIGWIQQTGNLSIWWSRDQLTSSIHFRCWALTKKQSIPPLTLWFVLYYHNTYHVALNFQGSRPFSREMLIISFPLGFFHLVISSLQPMYKNLGQTEEKQVKSPLG